MSELPPEFTKRLAAISRRRIRWVRELRQGFEADMRRVHHTIGQEVQTLYEEFGIPFPEEVPE